MRSKLSRLIAITLLTIFVTSCGGRLPSPQTAHKLLTKSFHKYGNKYKTSDFGQHPVEKVEISDIRELQKNMVEIEGVVRLEGDITYHVRVTLQKKSFGWKYVAWENLAHTNVPTRH